MTGRCRIWELALGLLFAAPFLTAQSVVCPSAFSGKSAQPFERISVFNGKSGGPEYDLVPDDESRAGTRLTQVWRLSEYRSLPMFVRCRYKGTEEVINLDLPEPLKTCTYRFNIDKRGRISGPFEMECR